MMKRVFCWVGLAFAASTFAACGGTEVSPGAPTAATPSPTPAPPKTFAYSGELVHDFDEATGVFGPGRPYGLPALVQGLIVQNETPFVRGQRTDDHILVGEEHDESRLGLRSVSVNPDTGALTLTGQVTFTPWTSPGSDGLSDLLRVGNTVFAKFGTRGHNHTSSTPYLLKAVLVDPITGALAIGPLQMTGTISSLPSRMVAHPRGRWIFAQTNSVPLTVFEVMANGDLEQRASYRDRTTITRLFVDPTGRYLYAAHFLGSFQVIRFDETTGALTEELTLVPDVGRGFLLDVAFDPTGNFISFRRDSRRQDLHILKIDKEPALGLRSLQSVAAPFDPYSETEWAPGGRAFVSSGNVFLIGPDDRIIPAGTHEGPVTFLRVVRPR